MSFEYKVSNSISTKPKHRHWWQLDTLEGASVNKAVPTTKGFKVLNENFWTIWIKNRISVVFSCIYRQNMFLQSSLITPDTPRTAAVVLELLEPLFGHGHNAVEWQLLQQYRISKEAKDRTFHWLCWHTGKKYTAALI